VCGLQVTIGELFSDAALVDLLDHFPRRYLYALNMGTDPTRVEENRLALHEGVSGAELLQAVRTRSRCCEWSRRRREVSSS
jgi:hypothetical protein